MVLYIAKRGPHDMGTKTHRQAIKDIYGSENVFEVDLLNKDTIETDNYISFGNNLHSIPKRIERYMQGNVPMISNNIIYKICNIISDRSITLVFSEESDLGNLYKKIKQSFTDVKIICFFHDIIADLYAQRLKSVPFWKLHYILELKRGIQQEKVTTQWVDECWTFHEKDANRLINYYNRESEVMIPVASFVPSQENIDVNVISSDCEKLILFVCSSYYVNIDGFKWFYNNVLPYLHNNYKILLVGNGTDIFNDLNSEYNIEIVGKVESMEKYYRNADIVIAPVFDGGGMKIKTLEAISYGKCIISTSESLNGYWECVPDNIRGSLIYNCNTSDEWISACNKLINSETNKFNSDIYKMFVEYFSYDSMLKAFSTALKMDTNN